MMEKVNKAQQRHFGGQNHNFPVYKKIFKGYYFMVRCKKFWSCEQWVVKTKWATFAIIMKAKVRAPLVKHTLI